MRMKANFATVITSRRNVTTIFTNVLIIICLDYNYMTIGIGDRNLCVRIFIILNDKKISIFIEN